MARFGASLLPFFLLATDTRVSLTLSPRTFSSLVGAAHSLLLQRTDAPSSFASVPVVLLRVGFFLRSRLWQNLGLCLHQRSPLLDLFSFLLPLALSFFVKRALHSLASFVCIVKRGLCSSAERETRVYMCVSEKTKTSH